MEEKERNYEFPLGVPGGHNLPDEICISSDLVNRHNGDRRKDFKAGGQSMTLPRYIRAHSDENHTENGGASDVEQKISSRKVDSLPSNITMLSLEQGKRNKRKGVLKSVGYFFQRLTRRFSLANSTNGIKIKLGQRGSGSTASSNSSNGGNGSLNDYGTLGGRRSENSSAGGSSHTLDRNCAVSSTQPSSCRLTLEEIPGMIGIHNHGNTCFMNAIIQCLSNTEPLLSYFLSDQYKEDIKRTNKHNSKRFGTKGELTEHLATLLKSLWLKKYTTDISTEFRTIVGKYGSQYRGSFQHDVQEFLIWLLDKVHEDLNIATKKKYRANKSSFGRTDEEVAAEAMANHARSNNSFIHDLFQALYMSSLTCPTCKHQSNTFDPFLSVSLPIPRTSLFQPVLVTCLGDGRSRPACRKVGVVLERGHTVKDLKEELVGGGRFFEGLATAELLILEVTGKNEFHILDDSKLISDPLNNELLYALDISAQSQTADLHKNSFDASANNQSDRDNSSSNKNQTNLLSTNKLEQSDGLKYPTFTNGHSVHPANEQSRLPSSDPIGREAKVGNEVIQCHEAAENPEMALVIVMNSIPCEDQERKLTVPSLLRLPVSTVIDTNRLDVVLKESLCIPKDKEAKYYLITDSGTSDFVRAEVVGPTQAELDEVKRSLIQAATTSICKDRSIQPVFRLLVEWNDSSIKKSLRLVEEVMEDESVQVAMKLQLQANKGTLDECFQVYTQEEMLGEDNDWHCPNCRAPKRGATKSLTLWSLPEILVIHLKRFRQDHEHRSKLNTLIQFPLTGLDLHHHMPQRSKSVDPCDPADLNGVPLVGGNWNAAMQLKSSKQQSSWLSWRLGCKTDGSVYDLYAVCNHYGDMQGGHYTAFCRNPVTNTWCLFNDSRCTPIKEDEVVTRAAYLLFYQKRSAGSSPPSERDFESRADPTTNGIRDPEVAVSTAVAMATGVNFADSCGLPKSQQATFTKSAHSNLKKQNFEVNPSTPIPSSSQSLGQVTVPLSSVESRPWLVALLEERRRLHGLSHTITQAENNRISRAITSHSLDDLLDGDCDESREDDFRGIPVYTTLHPPPRIKKQLAKAPMATVSTDSVPMAGVSDVIGQSELTKSNGDSFPEKNSFDRSAGLVFEPINSQQTSSSIVNKSTCLTNQPSSSIPSTNGKVLPTNCGQDKMLTPPPRKTDQSEAKLKPTLVRQRFLEGID